jgi:hypothetical protein
MGRDPNCERCWGTGYFKGWGAPCDCEAPADSAVEPNFGGIDWGALGALADERQGVPPWPFAAACDKTFEGCRANGNEVRFGGALPHHSKCPFVFKDRNCGLTDDE